MTTKQAHDLLLQVLLTMVKKGTPGKGKDKGKAAHAEAAAPVMEVEKPKLNLPPTKSKEIHTFHLHK